MGNVRFPSSGLADRVLELDQKVMVEPGCGETLAPLISLRNVL